MGFVDSILRRDAKASATTEQVVRAVMTGPGNPIYTPISYRELARQGYRRNPWVYRSISTITAAVKGTPWVVYRDGGGGAAKHLRRSWKGNRDYHAKRLRRLVKSGDLQLVEFSPLLDLLHKPNPEMGGGAFFEAYVGYLMLTGNSYVEGVFVGPEGIPFELWPARPDRMFVLPDAKNRVMGYEYRVGAPPYTRWTHGEVMHTKLWHPDNDWYGMAPIEAAARSVDQHNSAQDWNTAMFQNRAQPPGAFVVEGTLDDNEFGRVKAEVAEQYAGTSNARKPMLLEGGLDWKEMGLSPVEMDWLDGKRANAAEICAVFGVPPEMVGDSSGRTYSNYQEARKAFYMETVLPLLDHLRDDLNAWLTPRFGDNLYLDYDRDSIEALQDDRETLFGRAQAASFLTEDEKREMVGLPPLPNNVGEVVLRPTLTIAVPLTTATPVQAPAPGAKAWNLQTDEAKSAHWHATDALRTAWDAKVSEMIARRFTLEGDAVHGALAAHPDDALTYVDRAVDSKAWVDTLGVAYRAVMQDFGARVLEGLKAEAGEREWKAAGGSESVEDWWSQGAEAFVQATVAQRVTGITETTKAVLAALVQEGIAAGESIPDIARRIRSTYESFSEARSTLIARTETIAASSAGSRYAAESTGLPLEHEWLATPDDRTRADHRKASGQRRPMAEPYEVGGYALMFPGDPTAPPSETIQCRCAELFHVVS